MSMRGTSGIPGLAHLCQLYHRLLSDSDLRYSTHPPRATCLPQLNMTCASKLEPAPCNTGLWRSIRSICILAATCLLRD